MYYYQLLGKKKLWQTLIALLILPFSLAFAQKNGAGTKSTKADYLFIIDNSNSIKTASDKELMKSAIELIIDILDEGDKLGVIAFDASAKSLFSEVFGEYNVNRDEEKKNLLALQFEVNQSNITSAFVLADEIGLRFWRNTDQSGRRIPKIIVLVSDGRLYTSPRNSIPESLQNLRQIIKNRFSDMKLYCLEISTEESKKIILDSEITGSELLKELSGGTNQYHKLGKLYDIWSTYVEVISQNKIFPYKNLPANGVVDILPGEEKVILIKRNESWDLIGKTEDIKVRLYNTNSPSKIDTIITYGTHLERGSTIRRNLKVIWNSFAHFDIIRIQASKEWTNYSMRAEFSASYILETYHANTPEATLDISTPNAEPPYFTNQKISLKIKPILRNEGNNGNLQPYEIIAGKITLFLYQAESTIEVAQHEVEELFSTQNKGSLELDFHKIFPDIAPSNYDLRALSVGTKSNENIASLSLRIDIEPDYLQPIFPPTEISSGNQQVLEFPIEIWLDQQSPYYIPQT